MPDRPTEQAMRVSTVVVAVCALMGSVSVVRAETVVIAEDAALEAAEASGAAFARVMATKAQRGTTDIPLGQLALWRSIANVLERDVVETQRADKQAGVGVAGNGHRLFDVGWLVSDAARFSLVGIAARFDRRAFYADGCGEIRLIYRLGYYLPATARRAALASFLPLTVSVELLPDAADGCGRLFAWWKRAARGQGAALGTALLEPQGPLRAALDDRRQWHRVAVNVQRVRWPSAVRPDLGGHAEYALRAFAWDAATQVFVPAPLENTPDVATLQRGSKRWTELRNWLADPVQRSAIERGTVVIPEKFLATRSLSVTPRGLARLANRPFRQVFRPADFASLPYTSTHVLRSPEAFVRRLDELSCAGCHQSRAVAGFHWIGVRAIAGHAAQAGHTPAQTGGALPAALPDTAVAFSPHVAADLPRRQRALLTDATDATSSTPRASSHRPSVVEPGPSSATQGESTRLRTPSAGVLLTPAEPGLAIRPFAERSELDRGRGSACGLGDPGFADWTCPPNFRCIAVSGLIGENFVGECVPATPQAGDACEPAQITAVRDSTRDRAQPLAPISCGDGLVCQATRVGFPGGMCSGSCDPLPPGGRCGAIAILTPFNNCLARGQPFSHCAQQHSHPAGLAACSQTNPCRDDYLCASSEHAGPGEGTCIPPYFLLSLRVDGHPRAEPRR